MSEEDDMVEATTWAVSVELTGTAPLAEHEIDKLLDALAPHSVGAVSAGPDTPEVGATFDIHAATAPAALASAAKLLYRLLPGWSIERAEIMTAERQEAELERPVIPELVGVAEVAEILGVTRQRASKIPDTNPRFPKPVQTLRGGPLWRRTAVESFAADRAKPSATLAAPRIVISSVSTAAPAPRKKILKQTR